MKHKVNMKKILETNLKFVGRIITSVVPPEYSLNSLDMVIKSMKLVMYYDVINL